MNKEKSTVTDLYCKPDQMLSVVFEIFENASMKDLPVGIALVVNENNQLIGTVTDGDIRRCIGRYGTYKIKIGDCMQNDPIYFNDGTSLSEIINRIPAALSQRKRKSQQFLNKIVLVDKNRVPTRVLEYHQLWEQKSANHRHLVVVGLGYVGLTMALVMADAGYRVTGVEQDISKVQLLLDEKSYIHELGLESLLRTQLLKRFFPVTEMPDDGDVFIISVGTPVIDAGNGKKLPTLEFLEDACKKIGTKLKTGNLIVLRSTVPIGTCRNFVSKKLEEASGLTCGIDFHLAFAPERTAEGKALKELRSLPQIIGGYNTDSLEATVAIFKEVTPTIVRVESMEAAEMAKLMNNTYRDYIFAYANNMARIASDFNINIHEVISAANRGYPRDPIPLPSPGVGGPCLTKDAHIFASNTDAASLDPAFIIQSRKANELMHSHVATRVIEALKNAGKNISECRILLCGIAFKGNPETGDIRNSSALEIYNILKNTNCQIFGFDPVASYSDIEKEGIIPLNIENAFINADAVLFLNNHKHFEKLDLTQLVGQMAEKPVIFDGWNLFRKDEILAIRPCAYVGLSYMEQSL
jgi:UDP-N-acetyl-D-mannosaminuronic acid dehydrogenase